MSAEPTQNNHWSFDRRVPIAVIFAIVMQSGAALWWAATISSRVGVLERDVAQTSETYERVIRLEGQVENNTRLLQRIDEKLDRALEN